MRDKAIRKAINDAINDAISDATTTYFSIMLILALSFTCAHVAAQAEPNAGELDENSFEDSSEEQIRFISDELFTYLRAGPGQDYRLLGSINAGSRVSLLNVDREAGYAEIVDDRERTGWVEIRFVSRIPTIRYQLDDMQNHVETKDQEMSQMQADMNAVMTNLAKFDEQKAALNRQITQQLEEIARLNEKITQRERTNNMEWFSRGAIIAGISILLGYFMGLFGRKRKNGDRLM